MLFTTLGQAIPAKLLSVLRQCNNVLREDLVWLTGVLIRGISMFVSTVFIAAAVLSSSRFGPNDMVLVEKEGSGARITAYGDAQIVKINALDFEMEDCIEVFNDGLNPGRCLFSEGGLITLTRDPNGTRFVFQGAGRTNIVEFVVYPPERKRAAKALATP